MWTRWRSSGWRLRATGSDPKACWPMRQSPARCAPWMCYNGGWPMPREDAEFQALRPRLFALAYRMLGTRADAEDVVQEAWLRWQSAGDEEIRAPKSWLTTVVAHLALDALKAAHRR